MNIQVVLIVVPLLVAGMAIGGILSARSVTRGWFRGRMR